MFNLFMVQQQNQFSEKQHQPQKKVKYLQLGSKQKISSEKSLLSRTKFNLHLGDVWDSFDPMAQQAWRQPVTEQCRSNSLVERL